MRKDFTKMTNAMGSKQKTDETMKVCQREMKCDTKHVKERQERHEAALQQREEEDDKNQQEIAREDEQFPEARGCECAYAFEEKQGWCLGGSESVSSCVCLCACFRQCMKSSEQV